MTLFNLGLYKNEIIISYCIDINKLIFINI